MAPWVWPTLFWLLMLGAVICWGIDSWRKPTKKPVEATPARKDALIAAVYLRRRRNFYKSQHNDWQERFDALLPPKPALEWQEGCTCDYVMDKTITEVTWHKHITNTDRECPFHGSREVSLEVKQAGAKLTARLKQENGE